VINAWSIAIDTDTAVMAGMIKDALTNLERSCPNLVANDDWQEALEDGRKFLAQWGDQAESLGWTADDLFGLHDPPEKAGPNYRRLSRVDATGLIWLLHGRPVVALTASAAVIDREGGPTFYRRSA
jgi:hypothetical protein